MNKYKFKNEECVIFNLDDVYGYGTVVGCSTVEDQEFGRIYLIKVLESSLNIPNDDYPYSVISLPEEYIKKSN